MSVYYFGDQSELTPSELENYNRMKELIDLCEVEQIFSIEGEYFIGNRIEAVKEYMRLNPSKKFTIWVKDNYRQLI